MQCRFAYWFSNSPKSSPNHKIGLFDLFYGVVYYIKKR